MISVARWSPCDSSPTRRSACAEQAAEIDQVAHLLLDARRQLSRLVPAQPQPARHLDRDAQVLAHRQLGEDLGDLEGARHPYRHPLVRRQRGDVGVVEQDAAGRGP